MKEKKRKKRMHPFIKGFLGCIAVAAIAGICVSFVAASALHSKLSYEEIESVSKEPFKEEGVKNILLIGNDSRTEDESGRSDAMILVSISSRTNTIHMTSLLRDIYVDIPGHDGNRLNAAYAYGGPELLMETLEENFDIEVNRYMLVNFQAFANLVDAVGGVDLEVTNEEVQYINGYLVEYNQLQGNPEGTDYLDTSLSGTIHLNGPQALAYCRNRYIGTDFARTERQRKVLAAAIKSAPLALVTNGGELIDGVMSNITTNLTKSELNGLMLQAPAMLTYDMISGSIPLEGTYSNANIRGMAVLEVDFEANKEYIQTEIYGK
ncbi:MAG: LCP family protein [Lachnospiraceae bacterium]|nr:LCP family protein [Lachnospiraceae bacterium]MEE1015985.1 LCP family protein [Lachnospiraceae bacterium]